MNLSLLALQRQLDEPSTLLPYGLGFRQFDCRFESVEVILNSLPIPYVKAIGCFYAVQPLDWFRSVDLSKAYFYVYIALEHSYFLRCDFQD